MQKNKKSEASRIKGEYHKYADRINDKRFHSPFLQRRYVHQKNYETFLRQVKPNMMVVDVGAGEGVLSILMAKKGAKVIAVEISKPNVEVANKLAKKEGVENNILFIVGDAENVPILSNQADLVVSSHVLEHLPDFNKGLSELKRITQKTIIIGLPTCLNWCSWAIVGGGNYWSISLFSPWHLLKGFILMLINIGKEGVNEKYVGMDFPHIWRYPWVIYKRFSKHKLHIVSVEATSLVPPYLLTYLKFLLPIYKIIDKFSRLPLLKYCGYGTTIIATKRKK